MDEGESQYIQHESSLTSLYERQSLAELRMVSRIVVCNCYGMSGTMLVAKHADTTATH